MNLLTAVLSGAVWVLAQLGLALLAALGRRCFWPWQPC